MEFANPIRADTDHPQPSQINTRASDAKLHPRQHLHEPIYFRINQERSTKA